MRSIGTRFARSHTDGSRAQVGHPKTVGSVAGNISGHIQADPGSTPKRAGGGQGAAKRWSIRESRCQFTPGNIRNCPGTDTLAVAVVGEKQQAHLTDRSAQTRDGEAQVRMHIRGAINTNCGGTTMIGACIGGINIGIRYRVQGQ